MSLWVWLFSIGVALFLMLCGAYAVRTKHRSAVNSVRLDEKQNMNAGACSEVPVFGGDTLPNLFEEPKQDPSSVYRGQIFFFDSVEHRDMFESNQYSPVMPDPIIVTSEGQICRRVQRSDDCHAYRQQHTGA